MSRHPASNCVAARSTIPASRSARGVLLAILVAGVRRAPARAVRPVRTGPLAPPHPADLARQRDLDASARHRHARARLPLAPDLRLAYLAADRRSSVMLISGLIGTLLGISAGYFGGRVDLLVTYLIDRAAVAAGDPGRAGDRRARRQLAAGRDPRARAAQVGPLRGRDAQRHAAGAQPGLRHRGTRDSAASTWRIVLRRDAAERRRTT